MNRVRPATLTDTAMIARIDVECWRSTYAGVLPDKFLLGLSENERRRLWSGYIARHPGDLILFARLVRSDLASAMIWVLRANPARFFYERLGGKLVSHRPLQVAGISVEAVAYGWPDLAAVLKTQARTGGEFGGDN